MEREKGMKEMERANKMGAKEDIVHMRAREEGYDLRDAREIGLKQFK